MHYEPRVSPTSQRTMLHRSHSTSPCWTEIESRARDLLVATTGIEQSFLWRQSPKASFSPNFPATMGKTETGDKTGAPIAALLPGVEGFSHSNPICTQPLLLNSTVSPTVSQESACTAYPRGFRSASGSSLAGSWFSFVVLEPEI